ncbi:MAG: dATP/dGTP diphosphohydrolase domain-containing protein [Gemmataceae bacterium]
MSYELPDSGQREQFSTGSRRDCRKGKGRWDLLPWIALQRVAIHTENGARKYGDRNWEKGQPISRYLDSAIRHITKYASGETSEDHLAAACWNLLAIMHHQHQIKQGNLPKHLGENYALKTEWRTGQPESQESNVPLESDQEGEAFTSYLTS